MKESDGHFRWRLHDPYHLSTAVLVLPMQPTNLADEIVRFRK